MPSVSQDIRDDIIAQEINYRRVDASVRREVDSRLLQLGRDLKKLILQIDVNGAKHAGAKKRRLKKLDKETKILIRTAYSEVGGITQQALKRVAKVETKKTVSIVQTNLP